MHDRRARTTLFLLIALTLCGLSPVLYAGEVTLIPRPVETITRDGSFLLSPTTVLVATGPAGREAERFIETVAPALGFRLERGGGSTAGSISLALDETLEASLGGEGYTLDVTEQRIELRAATVAGLFYGTQTLRQLLPPEIYSPTHVATVAWAVPCVKITDYPRFEWRGLLIDPARHFIPVEDVKHYLEAMALHKYNRLQVHLTDNEGWRIEIEKYPKLTELGSRMDWNLRYREGEGPRCFGYYTQDEIRELVRYATERHITIVPEIEMPYHAGSAIVAYPEHGVNLKHLAEQPPDERWGIVRHWRPATGLLGPRPETVAFMQDILAEASSLASAWSTRGSATTRSCTTSCSRWPGAKAPWTSRPGSKPTPSIATAR